MPNVSLQLICIFQLLLLIITARLNLNVHLFFNFIINADDFLSLVSQFLARKLYRNDKCLHAGYKLCCTHYNEVILRVVSYHIWCIHSLYLNYYTIMLIDPNAAQAKSINKCKSSSTPTSTSRPATHTNTPLPTPTTGRSKYIIYDF